MFLVIYGTVFYYLGSNFQISKILKVKGAKTQEKNKSIEIPQPYSDTQKGEIIASSVKLCSNTVFGFQVVYPNDWFTTYNIDNQKCTFFAPYSFVVPQETDKFFVPIRIEVVKIDDWPNTVKFYENPNDFQNILSVQNAEIGGKAVKKIKASSTGTSTQKKGLEKISFLIFNSKTPLVIFYQQIEENEDVKLSAIILEEMVTSLKYF